MSAADRPGGDELLAYQSYALARVSRTFALTIPQLPPPVRGVIGNAYLLCRIADTIEDEPVLDASTKREMLHKFADALQHRGAADAFATELKSLLSARTPEDEHDLVMHTPMVIGFNQQLPTGMRKPVERCVETMCTGMAEFVDTGSAGLPSMEHVDRYTYYVAGVVGEMITDVICDYSAEIAYHREELFALSSQFGRGLQLVNIIKDHNEDLRRGASWLPTDFGDDKRSNPSFQSAIGKAIDPRIPHLVGVARRYLEAALRYSLLIPAKERGIRLFLLWSLGLAALTLRRISANPQFKSGDEVKVSRRQVAALITVTKVAVRSNRALRWLFKSAAPPLSATSA